VTFRRLRLLLAGALLLGAGGVVRAQQAGAPAGPRGTAADAAPLEESKKALRQLQKDQAQGRTDPGGLRDAFPSISAPDLGSAAGAPMPPVTPDRRREEETARRQRAAQQNWLVDGVRRLEGKGSGSAGADEEDDEEAIEASDPDYLLKAYLKEQRTAEAARDKEEKDGAGGAVDPMTPFLRDWLSGSPVEQTVLSGLAGNAGRTAAAGSPAAGEPAYSVAPIPGGVGTGGRAHEPLPHLPGAPDRRENPFLQGLDLGGLPLAHPATSQAPLPGLSPVAPPPPAATPAVSAPVEVPLPSRGTDRRPPPSPLKENEKYFPQQKKF